MTAHEYAIIGHKRAEIGRWLGFASVVLAPILTSVITWASGWPLLTASIQAKMVAFTVSTGLVYAVLYWLFNRFVWRWLNKMLGIPEISRTTFKPMRYDSYQPYWKGWSCLHSSGSDAVSHFNGSRSSSFANIPG